MEGLSATTPHSYAVSNLSGHEGKAIFLESLCTVPGWHHKVRLHGLSTVAGGRVSWDPPNIPHWSAGTLTQELRTRPELCPGGRAILRALGTTRMRGWSWLANPRAQLLSHHRGRGSQEWLGEAGFAEMESYIYPVPSTVPLCTTYCLAVSL